MLASSLYVFTQYWSHWSTFTNLTKYGMQALSGYWEGFKNKHLGGGCKTVRASGVSVEIVRKSVRFLQFLIEFIRKVVYIKIKINFFFQLLKLFKVSKNQG